MANHALPTNATAYLDYTAAIGGRLDDIAAGLDPATVTVTNPQTNMIRLNSLGGTQRWERYNGSAWAALPNAYAISISGNAATATVLATARTINGQSFNGSANIIAEPYVERDDSSNAARYIMFVDSATAGYQRANMDNGFTYNPSTNTLTCNITGDVAGNAATASALTGTLAIANGGTGAKTAEAARTNIGAPSLSQIYPSWW